MVDQFIGKQPHMRHTLYDLDNAYREMAADSLREDEALQCSNAVLEDISNEKTNA